MEVGQRLGCALSTAEPLSFWPQYKRNKRWCYRLTKNMDVHALGAHRTYNKHAVNSVTYAMRLIARLIDDTVTSWLSNKTHFITSHNVACKAIL